MRLKLSYTVDEKDVLVEAAKMLNLAADDMKQGISLFNDVQVELRGENDEETSIPNIGKVLEMIEEFRHALLNVDTRLQEVGDIVQGYTDYCHKPQPGLEPFPSPSPGVSVTENIMADVFGSD